MFSLVSPASSMSELPTGPAEISVTGNTGTPTRSRTSSFSSVTSDTSSFFGSVSVPLRHNYAVPSDMESASEVEDSGVALNTVTKEDLFRMFRKMQQRSTKYKTKLMQV